ncbi:MAG: nucleotide pyrophosphohydrolase [Muribaculaceae bacterium]|nr:nucleotide pyrophosphohydrolase [Muribaculaceae bacterium]
MTTENPLTLAQVQEAVDRWIRSIGVRYFSPLTNLAILAEECGEVARVIARTDGEQSSKPGERLDLADELADLLWVAIAIANQHGIDLTEAFRRNLEKKTARDASRHIQNPKLT